MPKSGEKTRAALLDAASRIVQQRGVEHLTLDLTAQEAGVSKGGLLYHFPSKEALIKGMIQSYLPRFTADFNAAAQADAPAAGRPLDNNDAYPFFDALDDLLRPGPTRTNVNDLMIVFVRA